MEKITIFTPTYNRKHLLPNLYKSLLEQDSKDFVWLIVDDGSTDGTDKYIEQLRKDNKIIIQYYHQNNKGKSQAHNYGVSLCKTELFVCVDSDDYISDNCVSSVINKWKEKDNDDIGVLAFCSQTFFNKDKMVEHITLREAYNTGMISGDTMLIYKTSAISKYSFPHFEGESFVPENYLYDLLDKDGTLLVLPEVLYFREYVDDGYTKHMNKVIKNNPNGYIAYIKNRLLIDKGFKTRLLDSIRYVAILKVKGSKVIKNLPYKFIGLLAYPFGVVLYIKKFRGA